MGGASTKIIETTFHIIPIENNECIFLNFKS